MRGYGHNEEASMVVKILKSGTRIHEPPYTEAEQDARVGVVRLRRS
jgi:hypothetical protein